MELPKQVLQCWRPFSILFLKESPTDLALHFCNTVRSNASEPEISSFFIPCILLLCQNLAPTLPTMQLDHQQFNRIFRCVMLVAANVASSLKQRWGACYRGLVRSLLSSFTPTEFFHFQTRSPQSQLTLTQVTSLEDIYRTSRCSLWRHSNSFFHICSSPLSRPVHRLW